MTVGSEVPYHIKLEQEKAEWDAKQKARMTEGKYFCNTCRTYSFHALRRGSGWIEVILYIFFNFYILFIPGIIYSIWRRQGKPNVCPNCRSQQLISAPTAKAQNVGRGKETSSKVKCPYCAEFIKMEAIICRYCGRELPKEFVEKNGSELNEIHFLDR